MWQEVQGTLACPFGQRNNPVVLWVDGAVSQLTVLWHPEQFRKNQSRSSRWMHGFVVCCHVVKWHPEFPQSFAAIVNC